MEPLFERRFVKNLPKSKCFNKGVPVWVHNTRTSIGRCRVVNSGQSEMKGGENMDTNIIEIVSTMIGSLGFPVVCCWFMWKYINTTMKDFTNTMTENTKMLNKICDRLDMWKTEQKRKNGNE